MDETILKVKGFYIVVKVHVNPSLLTVDFGGGEGVGRWVRVRVCGCGILRQGQPLAGGCVCVGVEVETMAENRLRTYRRGTTSGAPSLPSAPELVR